MTMRGKSVLSDVDGQRMPALFKPGPRTRADNEELWEGWATGLHNFPRSSELHTSLYCTCM